MGAASMGVPVVIPSVLLSLALVPPCPSFTPVTDKVIETAPAIFTDDDEPGRVILPDGTAEYTFTSVSECTEPLPPVAPEDPNDFAPSPPAPIDPEFDEHSPTGPGEGPPGAPTVDRPDLP